MDQVYEGIRNANEEFIATKLDQVWETSKYCRCDRCKRDVYTYVLNKIDPHYVDSTAGELFMKLNFRDKGHNIEIIKVINAAMEVVGRNPKHETPAAEQAGEETPKEPVEAAP